MACITKLCRIEFIIHRFPVEIKRESKNTPASRAGLTSCSPRRNRSRLGGGPRPRQRAARIGNGYPHGAVHVFRTCRLQPRRGRRQRGSGSGWRGQWRTWRGRSISSRRIWRRRFSIGRGRCCRAWGITKYPKGQLATSFVRSGSWTPAGRSTAGRRCPAGLDWKVPGGSAQDNIEGSLGNLGVSPVRRGTDAARCDTADSSNAVSDRARPGP
jgi:hypothetical protein